MEDPGLGVVGRKGQPSELTAADVRDLGAGPKGWAPRGGVREPSFLTEGLLDRVRKILHFAQRTVETTG